MDIRDISDVSYPGANALEAIFDLQKELLEGYIKIEGLPQYPIDINTKTSQNLIKDFSARIIEELGEGFESYLIMLDMFHKGAPEGDMIPHLQNFNEELSDAIHFWLELLIYSGFEIKSLSEWIAFQGPGGLLEAWFNEGKVYNERELMGRRYPGRWVIKDHQLKDEFLRGGRLLSEPRRDVMKNLLWDITYWLQIARNTLKNKPWKQTGVLTDIHQYEKGIANSTLSLFKFLQFTGFNPVSVYEIYYKKNRVNFFRQQSKY